jgi:hypothetical protein
MIYLQIYLFIGWNYAIFSLYHSLSDKEFRKGLFKDNGVRRNIICGVTVFTLFTIFWAFIIFDIIMQMLRKKYE